MSPSHRTRVVWSPHPGSQVLFLACPAFECLYEGTRGPGKTDALLMDFLQHVGQGHGPAWRGILFRRAAPQLEDVMAKAARWFPRIFPGARFYRSRGDLRWVFPQGEELLFRAMAVGDDYWAYHGHEYPWVGWEELTNWPTADCYERMKACCRSSDGSVPRKYRATCNPHGVGHNWVKARFVDPAPPGVLVGEEGAPKRTRVHGDVRENAALMAADPDYLAKLSGLPDKNLKKAWLTGSWEITAGGALDDLWSEADHVLEPFPLPASWRLDRSFDWGASRPYSVGYWAESDGTPARMADGRERHFPPGTLFRIHEIYGWTGTPDEGVRETPAQIARRILAQDKLFREAGHEVQPGPADSAIFAESPGQVSIAKELERRGVRFTRGEKFPGSRVGGLARFRTMLAAAKEFPSGAAYGSTYREDEPGFYVFETCRQFLRTVPCLPRSPTNPEDVDTTAEDHVYDESRYRVLAVRHFAPTGQKYWK